MVQCHRELGLEVRVYKRNCPPPSWCTQRLCLDAVCPGKRLDLDFLRKLNNPGKKDLDILTLELFKEKPCDVFQ